MKGKSIGGKAAAAAMTAEQKKARALAGVAARREIAGLPKATHSGILKLGDREISAAVLPDGTRLLTQSDFMLALGRSRTPKAGTGVLGMDVDELPFFLSAKAFEPFIDEGLRASTQPVHYLDLNGKRSVGYPAELLPKTCEVYLKFRDHLLQHKGQLDSRYSNMIAACDLLMRGLAQVGIVALVDEATGYQRDREKDALAKILEAFVAKELQPWLKTFPDDYYKELFRLYQLPYPPTGNKGWRPSFIGNITNDVIYARIAPELLPELKKAASKAEKKAKLHQWLTGEVGHPKLREHLSSIVTLLKLSKTPADFKEKVDLIHPALGQTYLLDFTEQQ